MDYPDELQKYLGRKIWQTKMNEVNNNPDCWPVFVKPLEDKQFTGVVVRSPKDLIGCGIQGVNQDVYCSEIVKFEAEWRCFVRYGHILSVRPYKGDWRKHYDYKEIENAVKEFTSAPAGYAIDFGLTDDGRTLLIEVNDGYALGCYGLFYWEIYNRAYKQHYARFMKKKMSKSEFAEWGEYAIQLRQKAADGELEMGEYQRLIRI